MYAGTFTLAVATADLDLAHYHRKTAALRLDLTTGQDETQHHFPCCSKTFSRGCSKSGLPVALAGVRLRCERTLSHRSSKAKIERGMTHIVSLRKVRFGTAEALPRPARSVGGKKVGGRCGVWQDQYIPGLSSPGSFLSAPLTIEARNNSLASTYSSQ